MQNFEEIKIAIAEDHKMFREALVKILTDVDHRLKFTIEAGDGEELINGLNSAVCLPDVVLLDISMPVLNGYNTLKKLRKSWPKLKVLVVSMYNEDYSVVKMMLNGANGFISKSEEPKKLLSAIDAILKGNKYYLGSAEQFLSFEIETLKHLIPTISSKEMIFLSYCGLDMRYEEIAQKMGVGIRTVDSYRDNLFKKLNTNSRVGLALFALKTGLVTNCDVCK